MRVKLSVLCLALMLAACSGGGGGRSNNPQQNNTIGPTGGTVQGPNGSQVVIPAGALSQPTAIAIARSSAGAPPLPPGSQTVSDVFAFTPHGTTFAVPVTVTFAFDASRAPAGVTPIVYKTNAAQDAWEPVQGATLSGGMISMPVSSFSWGAAALPQPPQIIEQPQSVTVVEGSGAAFDVRTVSTFDVTYQWQRANGGRFIDIAGATQRSFEIGSVAASDNGAQFCVAVAVGGIGTTLSAIATLTVTPSSGPPVIVSEPQNQSVLPDTDATFAVTATGPGLRFQWSRADDVNSSTFNDIVGATGAIYALRAQPGDNRSRFQVTVTNSLGGVTSAAALLTVRTGGPVTGARIGAGSFHSVARLASGQLVSWGSNRGFYLGAGPQSDPSFRREVPGPVVNLTGVIAIAVGFRDSLAFLANGELWGWGENQVGALGDSGSLTQQEPQRINGVDGAIAACIGGTHSLFLFSDGTVRALGGNFQGQLGDGTTVNVRDTPVTVLGIQSAVGIACGGDHSLAVLADGSVRAWGDNTSGQLGNGTTVNSNIPVRVQEVVGAVAVAAGGAHSLALLPSRGQIRAWGSNRAGQLGDGTQIDRLIPVLGPGVSAETAGLIQIAAGGETSIALQGDGDVFTWGDNTFGQLGFGELDGNFPVPSFATEATRVDRLGLPPFETRVDEIAMSYRHAVVLGADGRVYTWGFNEDAQLGIGPVPPEPFIFPAPQVVVDLDLD